MLTALAAAPLIAQVDFSGEWAPLYHEDAPERLPGPELGDYTGLPINAAARMRADSWDADRISVVEEYQCRPNESLEEPPCVGHAIRTFSKDPIHYDTQYAGSPDMFVEAVYKSLKK